MSSEAMFIVLSVSIFTALIFAVLGYLIAIKDKQDLINGVDFSALSDPKEFTRCFGFALVKASLLILAISLLLYFGVFEVLVFTLLYSICCCLPIVDFIKAKKKYSL